MADRCEMPTPGEDGSCSCGAILACSGDDPCPWCGGYTAEQAIRIAARETRHVAGRERAGERIDPDTPGSRMRGDDGEDRAMSDMIPW